MLVDTETLLADLRRLINGVSAGHAVEPIAGELADKVLALTGALDHLYARLDQVGSSRVDLQACKLEYSIVSPK